MSAEGVTARIGPSVPYWWIMLLSRHHAWCRGYLRDMLCSSGACDSAIATRCSVACGKFRKLLAMLNRHLSAEVHGKVYITSVCWARLHSSETWGLNTPDLQRFFCNDHAMIHWICGTKDWHETSLASLLQKLGIEDITAVLHTQRLRWSGQRATACMKSVTNFVIPATRKRGSST